VIEKFKDKAAVTASDFEGVFLALNNGDKAAIEEAMKRWKFKDEQSLLKFALAILIKAENNKVSIQSGGSQINLTPNESLLDENHPADSL
jgi:hypothetical protein